MGYGCGCGCCCGCGSGWLLLWLWLYLLLWLWLSGILTVSRAIRPIWARWLPGAQVIRQVLWLRLGLFGIAHLAPRSPGAPGAMTDLAHLADCPPGGFVVPTWRVADLASTWRGADLAPTWRRANLAHLAQSPPGSSNKNQLAFT